MSKGTFKSYSEFDRVKKDDGDLSDDITKMVSTEDLEIEKKPVSLLLFLLKHILI